MIIARRLATLLFALATTFAAQLLVLELLPLRRSLSAAASVAVVVTLALGLTIALAHAPLSWLLNRASAPIRRLAAPMAYAVLFPIAQLFMWLLIREENDAFPTLLAWYLRSFGEVLITAVPLALGGVVFGLFYPRQRIPSPI